MFTINLFEMQDSMDLKLLNQSTLNGKVKLNTLCFNLDRYY